MIVAGPGDCRAFLNSIRHKLNVSTRTAIARRIHEVFDGGAWGRI